MNFRTLGTSGSKEVRAAMAALRELTRQKIGDKPQAWLRWYRSRAERSR